MLKNQTKVDLGTIRLTFLVSAALTVSVSGCGVPEVSIASVSQASCDDGTTPGCQPCCWGNTTTCWNCKGEYFTKSCDPIPLYTCNEKTHRNVTQEFWNWCWVAVTKTVTNTNDSQCKIAEAGLQKICCDGNALINCNNPGEIQTQRYGVKTTWVPGIPADKLLFEWFVNGSINMLRKPVAIVWRWNDSSVQHIVTVDGFTGDLYHVWDSQRPEWNWHGRSYGQSYWINGNLLFNAKGFGKMVGYYHFL